MTSTARLLIVSMGVPSHMFPKVPYHALPKLHEMVKHDVPEPTKSMWAFYKEMLSAWLRQMRGEDYYLKRELPRTAKPYRPDLHGQEHAAE